MNGFYLRSGLAVAALLALAACSPTIEAHGDLPLPERAAQVEVGRTKSDVLTLLGTPSTTFSLGTERWYYISNQTKEYMYHEISEVERQILVIEFDKDGKVASIKKMGLADGQDISMASRTTPTTGVRLSIVGELLGNVGRFDTGK